MEAAKVESWNARVRPGDAVIYRNEFGREHKSRTRSAAELLNGHTAVVRDEEVKINMFDLKYISDETRRNYRTDFVHFDAYCQAVGATSMPASVDTVCVYLNSLTDAGLKKTTIKRRCAAISYAHRLVGHVPPTAAEPVRAALRGIHTAVERKAPATARTIAAMLYKIPNTLSGKRDRALLLLGFAAALRRSELVALDIGDVEMMPDKVVIHARRWRTDQEAHKITIPRGMQFKPVEALEAWLNILPETLREPAAPLFVSIGKGDRLTTRRLSDRAVAIIIKRWARAARLDAKLFSGHSLRAGFIVSALDEGSDPLQVMDITGHNSIEGLLKNFYRVRANFHVAERETLRRQVRERRRIRAIQLAFLQLAKLKERLNEPADY